MIRAMDVHEDLNAMQEMLESAEPLFSEHNQISVTCRPSSTDPLLDAIGWLPEGVAEADFSEITRRSSVLPLAVASDRCSRLPHALADAAKVVSRVRDPTADIIMQLGRSRLLHRRCKK